MENLKDILKLKIEEQQQHHLKGMMEMGGGTVKAEFAALCCGNSFEDGVEWLLSLNLDNTDPAFTDVKSLIENYQNNVVEIDTLYQKEKNKVLELESKLAHVNSLMIKQVDNLGNFGLSGQVLTVVRDYINGLNTE